MRVLGVDPGIGRVGYGVVEKNNESYRCIVAGCLTTPPQTKAADRLVLIQEQLRVILERYCPSGAAVEHVFFSKNTRTAMTIAEARGVILTTLARSQVPIIELSPQSVKIGVTGYGNATKRQVQLMVQKLLALPAPPTPDDVADALALAFVGLSHFKKK